MMHGELLEMIDVHGFEALGSNGAWEFQWIFQWIFQWVYNIHMVIVHPFSAGIGRDSYWRSYGIQFQWIFEWIPMDWMTQPKLYRVSMERANYIKVPIMNITLTYSYVQMPKRTYKDISHTHTYIYTYIFIYIYTYIYMCVYK
jgi:hypothetical protein